MRRRNKVVPVLVPMLVALAPVPVVMLGVMRGLVLVMLSTVLPMLGLLLERVPMMLMLLLSAEATMQRRYCPGMRMMLMMPRCGKTATRFQTLTGRKVGMAMSGEMTMRSRSSSCRRLWVRP